MPPTLSFFTLLIFLLLALTNSYTVMVSGDDSSAPGPGPALMDGPQMGFSMNHRGARTHPIEQQAVYDIMIATGNSWATGIPDVCRGRWHGIECIPDEHNLYHVISLSFGGLSEDTAFPTCDHTAPFISPSIIHLPHLRTLFFYRCLDNNPNPIPSFLGLLGPSLRTLVLWENGHVGPIPIQLSNLTCLTTLSLHNNNLNGAIPDSLGRINSLRLLDLSSNLLAGPIPDELNLPALKVLDLSHNMLTGEMKNNTLAGFPSLIKLDFSHNSLAGRLPEEAFSHLTDLVLMDLSYNNLSRPLPKKFKNLKSLETLILKGNPWMNDSIADDAFSGMNNLAVVVLSEMDLYGRIPSSLARLHRIRVIHLERNRFDGSLPGEFGDVRDLSELRLNDNRLSGAVPLRRDLVRRMRKKLRLGNNLGLCFDAREGVMNGSDAALDLGIGYCSWRSKTDVMVEHLWRNPSYGGGNLKERRVESSSASAAEIHNVAPLLHILVSTIGLALLYIYK